MNKIKRITASLLAVIITLLSVGCSEPPPADEGEVLAAAEKLLGDAVEVNRIFFWEGLPHTGKSSDSWMDDLPEDSVTDGTDMTDSPTTDTESTATETAPPTDGTESLSAETTVPTDDEFDLGDAEYFVLTEEYRYLSPEDLIEKAAAVYTESYTEDIYEIAFEGVVAGNEDIDVLYARYVTEMGELKINKAIVENALPESIPDLSTLKAVTLKHNSAVVSVEFTCEGDVTVREVTLRLEADGWRLDTPTY